MVGREHEFVVAFDTGALFFPICSEPLTPLGGVFLQKQKIGGTSALRTEIAPPQAAIALLSDSDDEDTASEAMRWGVRGFFPT